jgi:hypothetical protein
MNTIILPRKDAQKLERKICSSPMTQESDLNKLEKGTYKIKKHYMSRNPNKK